MDGEWAESLQNFSTSCLCFSIGRIRERRSLARDELPAAEVTLPTFALLVWNQAKLAGGFRLRARQTGQPQQWRGQWMRSRSKPKVATQSTYAWAMQAFQDRRERGEGRAKRLLIDR